MEGGRGGGGAEGKGDGGEVGVSISDTSRYDSLGNNKVLWSTNDEKRKKFKSPFKHKRHLGKKFKKSSLS